MSELTRGQKAKLADLTASQDIEVGVGITAPDGMVIDVSCFGVDERGQLSDERYFIFYNQKASPEGALVALGRHGGDHERFRVDLSRLPATIQRLVFTATIDGDETMAHIQSGYLRLLDPGSGKEVARFSFAGQDFQTERATIMAEIYYKNEWRIGAVGQGFHGGLSALLAHFGGQEAEAGAAPAPVPPPSSSGQPTARLESAPAAPVAPAAPAFPPAPSPLATRETPPPPLIVVPGASSPQALEHRLTHQAPGVLALAMTADLSLRSVGLTGHRARVALCLNISSSMQPLYASGKIQRFIERLLALACHFDDDGVVDMFLFARDAHIGNELSLDTFDGYTTRIFYHYDLEGGANYGKVMQAVRSFYFPLPQGTERQEPISARLPVYAMFLTDGATIDERLTRHQLQQSSYEPIFWQFLALGKSKKDVRTRGIRGFIERMVSASDFRFLEELDTMEGRYVDNANFFSTEDLQSISDKELFDLLMGEYPSWVQKARQMGLLDAASPLPRLPKTAAFQVGDGADDAGLHPFRSGNYSPHDLVVYFGMADDRSDITSGFRFTNLPVPEGAIITRAYLEFTADGPVSDELSLTIYGEASGNPKNFATHPPDTRPLTTASVPWTVTEEWRSGEIRRSPDLQVIVQELVNRPDWSPGNAMVFLVRNGGKGASVGVPGQAQVLRPRRRGVAAFDRNPAEAARLVLKFS
ncbi:MAG: hypothetical protein HC884_02775 [Chloroflexaceae bacterium]|nr:hypothetical protein [Chloroflexaceae bacterium]